MNLGSFEYHPCSVTSPTSIFSFVLVNVVRTAFVYEIVFK